MIRNLVLAIEQACLQINCKKFRHKRLIFDPTLPKPEPMWPGCLRTEKKSERTSTPPSSIVTCYTGFK